MGTVGHLFAAAITLTTTAAASAQFSSVGRPEGSIYSQVTGLSSGGEIAVGNVGFGNPFGFTWSRESGRYDLGFESQFSAPPSATSISGDGRVVAGRVVVQVGDQFRGRAYRWTGPGAVEILGDPGLNVSSAATDANRDGSVIVGNLTNQRGSDVRPFRWTAAGGMQSLGFAAGGDTEAFAVSDDGNTIVGEVSGAGRGFVWTVNDGYRLMTGLPGAVDGNAAIYAMNRAGTIYAGNSLLADVGTMGALWKNGSVINLGNLDGTRGFYPSSIDDAGTVVAGLSSMLGSSIATVWTDGRGIERLADYLMARGVTLPMHVQLSTCTSMSADGLTFAGTAYTGGDPASSFGYVVTIPAPASLVLAMLLGVPTRHRHPSWRP